MTRKRYDSAEQALVAELGAELIEEHEPMGTFLVADGDEDEAEFLVSCIEWLREKMLVPEGAIITSTNISSLRSGQLGYDIRVYDVERRCVEYRFALAADKTVVRKHYHFVEVSIAKRVEPKKRRAKKRRVKKP